MALSFMPVHPICWRLQPPMLLSPAHMGSLSMKRHSGPLMTIIFACAATFAAMTAPSTAPLAQGKTLHLVALGDSLTAGYGLPQEAAFPVVLEKALKARGYKVEIANAG